MVDLDLECRVCFEVAAFVALAPCGHRNMCAGCTQELVCRSPGGVHCPTCFLPVVGWSE